MNRYVDFNGWRLPPGPWPLRIDVLGLLGKGHAALSDARDGLCKLPLEAKDGPRAERKHL